MKKNVRRNVPLGVREMRGREKGTEIKKIDLLLHTPEDAQMSCNLLVDFCFKLYEVLYFSRVVVRNYMQYMHMY